MKLTGLGIWNVYFLAKFVLLYYGAINFDFITNTAFAAFLVIEFKHALFNKIKHAVGIIIAVILLYKDSWLPPLDRLTKQAGNVQDFSFGYFIEIMGRVINVDMLLGLFILIVVFWYCSQWIRFTTLTFIGLIFIGWGAYKSTQEPVVSQYMTEKNNNSAQDKAPVVTQKKESPEQKLTDFYKQQSMLVSNFPEQINGELFDVIVLNICSMAVDDLNTIGVSITDTYNDFDVVFSDFNSATSYSGPAAIRLMRASCGQTSQDDLFKDAPEQCYLFKNLEKLGYKSNLVMNHDGHFDDFKGLIKQYGKMDAPPFNIDSMPIAQYGFDNKPIYSDAAVLNGWLDSEAKSCKPCAMYYNTTSLHDGNQLANQSRMTSLKSYPARHRKLFSDIASFIQNIKQQNRNVMLLVVPEHGAALHGDKVQFAGLREIPSPAIVSIPVAVKFIGPNVQSSTQIVVKDTTSHFALSELISKTIETNVFGGQNSLANLIENLPTTQRVAENSGTVMMYVNQRPYIQLDGGDWSQYPL